MASGAEPCAPSASWLLLFALCSHGEVALAQPQLFQPQGEVAMSGWTSSWQRRDQMGAPVSWVPVSACLRGLTEL